MGTFVDIVSIVRCTLAEDRFPFKSGDDINVEDW
jgi:hypothetical protein